MPGYPGKEESATSEILIVSVLWFDCVKIIEYGGGARRTMENNPGVKERRAGPKCDKIGEIQLSV